MYCSYLTGDVIGNSVIGGLLYLMLRQMSISKYKELFIAEYGREPDITYLQADYPTFNVFQHAYTAGMMSFFIGSENVMALGALKEYRDVSIDSKIFESYKDYLNNVAGIEYANEIFSDGYNYSEYARIIFEDAINKEGNLCHDNDQAKDVNNFNYEVDNYKNWLLNQVTSKCNNYGLYVELGQYTFDWYFSTQNIDSSDGIFNGLFNRHNGYRCKFKDAKIAPPILKDPIIFDLNNDGLLETTDASNGIYFDYDNDGFAELTAWVSKNDGILVSDKNLNSYIDDLSEIITDENIGSYDTNNDGFVDALDTKFNEMQILKGDGTIQTLFESDISRINLLTKNMSIVDENSNKQFNIGTYIRNNGTFASYGGFLFDRVNSETIMKEWLEESVEISELPDICSRGNVHSLHQAMLRDESNGLKNLVLSFINETDDTIRKFLIDDILIKWTGSENVIAGSRGKYIDAKHLSILEKFMGEIFVSTYENIGNNQNPSLPAGQILETSYQLLKINIYSELMVQTHLSEIFENINLDYDEKEQTFIFNLDSITEMVKDSITENTNVGKELASQIATTIKGLGLDTYSNFYDAKDENCFYTTFTKNDRELKWLIDSIGKVPFVDEVGFGQSGSADDANRLTEAGHFHAYSGNDVGYGSDGDDTFSMCAGEDFVDAGAGNDIIATHDDNDIVWAGEGNDTVFASQGNDTIYGGSGNDNIRPDHGNEFSFTKGDDIVSGGFGNDTIISELGDDTFLFNLGDGDDFITDIYGNDTISFGEGITTDNVVFTNEADDLKITVNVLDNNGFVMVEDYFKYDAKRIENFAFSNGTVLTEISSLIVTPETSTEPQGFTDDGIQTASNTDINVLIQEMDSFGLDEQAFVTTAEYQQEENIYLAMVS